jgi:hypothetical protein
MKRSQLKEIIRERLNSLKEESTTITIEDLEFGKNIQKGDSLPKPNSDEMNTISSEDQLKWWKEDLEKAGVDFSSEVIIDRSKPWFDRFKIPAFEEGAKAASTSRGSFLDKEREQGKNKGLDEMSATGTGASFTSGTGEQYATPYSFKGKKKLPIIKKATRNS